MARCKRLLPKIVRIGKENQLVFSTSCQTSRIETWVTIFLWRFAALVIGRWRSHYIFGC